MKQLSKLVKSFDVAVVGASVAGCTAARLFAQSGARVALIERRTDADAYKVVCTHAILPPATPTIERLGLAPILTERGVPRPWAEVWTPYGGWFSTPEGFPDGWGVTRRTLDPVLARSFGEVLTRERSPFRLLDPRVIARLLVPRHAPQEPASVPPLDRIETLKLAA